MFGFATLEDIHRVADAVRAVETMRPADRGRRRRGADVYAPQVVLGKTDAAHNKAASGTISVWTGATAGAVADSGTNITAYNFFGNISSGKYVLCINLRFGWVIFAAEC